MVFDNKLNITDSAELARAEERISKAKALKIHDRLVFMKGIDASYHYEGYNTYKTGY